MMSKLDQSLLNRITKRGVEEIIVEKDFIRLLKEGRPLRLKMGFDPSRPDLHLGHVVGLRKLRELQRLGHQVILIVGDWTAQIGDPSGLSDTRSMLSAEEVHNNAETYMRQFFKIVDSEQTKAVYQSEWFGKFDLNSVIELTSKFTVNQFLHRDDFARRYDKGQPIAVTEMLYPLLQAFDSVKIQSDVEFGGTDQKFNLLVGRELQGKMGQRPQQCFLMPLLVGTDGVRKMSKSLDNYIAVDDLPGEMYGKTMSLPDSLLPAYFELLTDISEQELIELKREIEIGGSGVRDLKSRLASELVTEFHSEELARKADDEFRRVFRDRSVPAEVDQFEVTRETDGVVDFYPEGITVNMKSFLFSLRIVASKNEGRRLINQGAVEVNGRTVVNEPTTFISHEEILKIGGRRHIRIVKI